jgi:hypothetical protein
LFQRMGGNGSEDQQEIKEYMSYTLRHIKIKLYRTKKQSCFQYFFRAIFAFKTVACVDIYTLFFFNKTYFHKLYKNRFYYLLRWYMVSTELKQTSIVCMATVNGLGLMK